MTHCANTQYCFADCNKQEVEELAEGVAAVAVRG